MSTCVISVVVRTAGPSKKLTQQDCPTVALAIPQKPGSIEVVCTTKMVHAMIVYDNKYSKSYVDTLNKKYSTAYNLDEIRKMCGIRGKASAIYCCVMNHVDVFQQRLLVECRSRNGWGTASIPLFVSKSIDHWVRKRKIDDGGGDYDNNQASTSTSSESPAKTARLNNENDTVSGHDNRLGLGETSHEHSAISQASSVVLSELLVCTRRNTG